MKTADGEPASSEELESLEVGDVSVWIERGPCALVAGVIRGRPPRDLRAVFHVAVEDIHREQYDDLANFSGDTSPFSLARPHLEGCLQFQANPTVAAAAAKRSFFQKPAFLVAILLVGALGAAGGFWYAAVARWNGYLAAVQQQPGLVVTRTERNWWGKNLVAGLRDPMAADPRSFLAASGYGPDDVEGTWTPYQALEPPFVLARAKNLLAPPDTVVLVLAADGVLEASGLAPGSWIADARKLARAVPGVITFKDDRLVDERWAELQRLRDKVQVYNVLFAEGWSQPLPSEQQNLNDLIADLTRIVSLASEVRRPASIEIFGHTDGSGAEALNQTLSLLRAATVRAAIAAKLPRGVPITVKGLSNGDPLREERSDEDRAWNRRVSAKVTIGDVRPGEGR
jgi:OOP family OmpA-OmpF porin